MMPVRNIICGVVLICVAASCIRAQAPAGPITAPPVTSSHNPTPAASPGQPGGSTQEQSPAIRARVDIVSTPVTVQDASGELVLTLTRKDFHVFDNGVEQSIAHFDLGGDPLSIVLLAETSSRIESLLPAVRRAGIVFSQVVMGRHGEAAVMGFDDDLTLLRDFTGSRNRVQKAINELPEGTSGARLYDGMAQAVAMLKERPQNLRRIIVVMAESSDHGSESKLGQVLRDAQLANITIYTIGLSTTAAELHNPPESGSPPEITPPGTFGLPPQPGVPQTPGTEAQRYGNVNLMALAVWLVQHASAEVRKQPLEVASVATGGANIRTRRKNSIEKAVDNVGGELHAQYLVDYRPLGAGSYGYHEIRVTVDRPHVKVRTRPGYYLAPQPN
jgi:VWFA-related protein